MTQTQQQLTVNREAADTLRKLAIDLDAAARRVDDIVSSDTRHREAAQVRFVAMLVESCSRFELAEPWIAAASKMIAAYDAFDMHAVHESRASRRVEPEAHTDTLVNVSEPTA